MAIPDYIPGPGRGKPSPLDTLRLPVGRLRAVVTLYEHGVFVLVPASPGAPRIIEWCPFDDYPELNAIHENGRLVPAECMAMVDGLRDTQAAFPRDEDDPADMDLFPGGPGRE